MQQYDKVRLIKDREEYADEGAYAGIIGRICEAEIRDGDFLVDFMDQRCWDKDFVVTKDNMHTIQEDIIICVRVEDLELVEKGFGNDEMLLANVPNNDPRWWCKVEDGYIMNLLGEKKNKIPYNYNS